jgi:hypothetical protein
MKSTPWRKTFKHEDHLNDWADKNDADVHGTRDLEKSKVKEEVDQIGEMIGPNAAVMTPSQYDAYRLSLKNLKSKSKEKKEPSKEELAKKWQKYN